MFGEPLQNSESWIIYLHKKHMPPAKFRGLTTHILGFHWALHKDTGILKTKARSRGYLITYDKNYPLICHVLFHAYASQDTTFG